MNILNCLLLLQRVISLITLTIRIETNSKQNILVISFQETKNLSVAPLQRYGLFVNRKRESQFKQCSAQEPPKGQFQFEALTRVYTNALKCKKKTKREQQLRCGAHDNVARIE